MNVVWIVAGIEIMLIGIVGVALAAADGLEDFFGVLLAFNVILAALALGAWLISLGVS